MIDVIAKFAAVIKVVDFFSEVIDVFGFVNKFKQEVFDGFESVKQRLVTLEAKVEALFAADKAKAEAEAAKVEVPVEAEVKQVVADAEAPKDAA